MDTLVAAKDDEEVSNELAQVAELVLQVRHRLPPEPTGPNVNNTVSRRFALR